MRSAEPPASDDFVEVYRSPDARACRHRALVLRARGLPHHVARSGAEHVLLVPASLHARAANELASYERENVGWPPREALPQSAPGYWHGAAAYAALLILVFLLDLGGAGDLGWRVAGRIDGAAVRDGELWRTVTSLTLHTGLPHLLGNLVFGVLFGVLATYRHGGGLGWLAVLLSGALGNLTNAWLQSPAHLAVGASTAVFGAVGVLVGSEWRRRSLLRSPRLRRAAPPVMGLLLLAYLGVGGEAERDRVDVLAHATGLFWGVPLGALLASVPHARAERLALQAWTGLAAVALVAVAWLAALG